MRAPDFWNSAGLIAQILRPLGAVTASITARRTARIGQDIGLPVICIGNINVGGTGKTPTTIAVIERLLARECTAMVVMRGYGGRLQGPVLVNPNQHSAADVGDEALLLSAFAPVVVAKNRALGAILAKSLGAGVIVLDDGHQNPSLRKDLSIIVVDAEIGFGNGFCLPAGPLREPVAAGLARADMVISLGPDEAQTRFAQRWGRSLGAVAHLRAQLKPLPMGIDWQGAKVVAFAGIGRPEKFFATLRALGADVLHGEALPDHAPLPEPLLTRLIADAHKLGADLVTTEKDAARLPARFRSQVLTLPVRLSLENDAPLMAALDSLIALPAR
jgi:tetraacyldisaccharide 4'-kinase